MELKRELESYLSDLSKEYFDRSINNNIFSINQIEKIKHCFRTVISSENIALKLNFNTLKLNFINIDFKIIFMLHKELIQNSQYIICYYLITINGIHFKNSKLENVVSDFIDYAVKKELIEF
jgi:hypothetical protein